MSVKSYGLLLAGMAGLGYALSRKLVGGVGEVGAIESAIKTGTTNIINLPSAALDYLEAEIRLDNMLENTEMLRQKHLAKLHLAVLTGKNPDTGELLDAEQISSVKRTIEILERN